MIPTTVFPLDIDSDYTLFLVHNNSISYIKRNIDANDTEIEIEPVLIDESEIWSNNGFVKIDNELIYYDNVEKNIYNKVFKLKECRRGIESKAQFHNNGSIVYGNVIAQHHNSLANAILNLEKIIGDIQDVLKNYEKKEPVSALKLMNETIDNSFVSMNMALANLAVYPPISDDACPDVEFIFNILSTSPNTSVEFCVRIYGNYSTYILDFGNGVHTTEFAGTYEYPIGATVNPVVTVTSDNCCITQQPVSNLGCCDLEPAPDTPVPFAIVIPDVPDFPNFIAPSSTQTCPGPIFDLPPLIIPQVSITNGGCSDIIISIIGTDIPSVISIENCNLPSVISVVDCCSLPSLISIVDCCSLPSVISFENCNLPSIISFENCNLPSIISVQCCELPDVISFENCDIPSVISIDASGMPNIISTVISVEGLPTYISVDCCTIPSIISVQCCELPDVISFENVPSFEPISFTEAPTISVDWGIPPPVSCLVFVQCCSSTPCASDVPLAMNNFEMNNFDIPIETTNIGIPSEIKLVVPRINDVRLTHDLPKSIIVENLDIPSVIDVKSDLPNTIYINADEVPRKIALEANNIPSVIYLKPATDFPAYIEVKGIPESLQVVGIPSVIDVKAEIKMVMPENPFVELVYKGDGIPLNINLDSLKNLSEIILAHANK